MLIRLPAALLAAAAAFAPNVHAQSACPNEPLRIIVGYTTGGAADAGLRPLARVLEPLLGQPIVIECKPVAAGASAQTTEKARADFAKWGK